ncbi:MAG: Gfo/Idh/MocA family oxidoreductase, partial [Acidobacteriia bacterium]|nr:Gfo/Idh/MocA family oxidoreductase [Terriglobia bacterium]
MPEINVALIGHRFMGKAHSNAYRQLARFFPGKFTPRMKVLCGKACTEELEATAAQYGWEESDCEWERVIARKDIDIVDISVPGHLHYPLALAAARTGKHIICEKPLANTLAQAQEMLKAVEKAGVLHMVNFNYRRVPAVALARQMIQEGRLGKIHHYHGAYFQDWIIDPSFPLVWRMEKKYAGSGALGDIGAHAADLAQFLNSDITSVVGQMTTFVKERPLPAEGEGAWGAKGKGGKGRVTVDDDANFLASFRNGSIGVFQSSRFAGGRRNYNSFHVYGSEGSLAFNMERMNELEFYDRTEPQAEQGFKTILATESVHPYVGAWWPPGHIIGYEHTFVHAVHD